MAENFVFAPAAREEIKAKIALTGASGGGKTLSALFLAYGLCGDWKKIAVADTENGSAKQYCGQTFGDVKIPSGAGSFFHCDLGPPYGCERMIELIEYVERQEKYEVLVFDSFSHAWSGAGGVLETVDKIGKLEGWKKMTPLFRKLIDTVRFSSLHFIGTMRTRTEFEVETSTNEQGKTKVVGVKKLGTKPEMRDGVDYEFTTVFALNQEHFASVDKDRTNLFASRPPALLDVGVGKLIGEWAAGAVCQIGSAEWVKLRADELENYGGTIDGLATLWKSVAGHKPRLVPADFARLLAAKDASKARIGAQS